MNIEKSKTNQNIADVLVVPFLDDLDKMKDFLVLSKEEFLDSYSYMTEEEYDETLRVYHIIVEAQAYALLSKLSKDAGPKIPEPAVHAHHHGSCCNGKCRINAADHDRKD